MFFSHGYKQYIMKSTNSERMGVEPGWIIMEWLHCILKKIYSFYTSITIFEKQAYTWKEYNLQSESQYTKDNSYRGIPCVFNSKIEILTPPVLEFLAIDTVFATYKK